jgi:MFS family permease
LAGLGYAIGIARSPALMYCALAFNSMGSGFANVGLSALVSRYAGAEEQGRISGVFRSFGALARACSPAVAGLLFFNAGGTLTFVAAGALLLVPAALALPLPQPRK